MAHPPNETKRTFWRRDVSRIVSTAAADFFFAPLALLARGCAVDRAPPLQRGRVRGAAGRCGEKTLDLVRVLSGGSATVTP